MNRKGTLWSRRSLLKSGAGVTAAAATGTGLFGMPAIAQQRILYVNTWGGAWTAAEEAAYFKPFTAATGIQIRTVAPVSFAKLKAQVQTKSYEWDVTSLNESEWYRAAMEGLVEPVDYSIVKKETLFPDAIYQNGMRYQSYSTNLVYRKDKFPNGGPQSWADFWDVKKFPGRRSLYYRSTWNVVFALLADGVPPEKIYPIDIDRAFRKLDQIKPHITVWWKEGNQGQQLIRDGEVDMAALWNSRTVELFQQKVPIELVWNGALIRRGVWGVAKGAPNAKLAWEFLQFTTRPEGHAEFARRLFYAPANPKAYDLLEPEVAKQLPTYAENAKTAVIADPEWEAPNTAALDERFTQWLAT